jgi:hypothetical protein
MTTKNALVVLFAPVALLACSKTESGAGSDAATQNTDTAVSKCITVADDLIADFEEDNGLYPADGRQGGFYLYGDDSLAGKFEPPLVKNEAYLPDKTTGNPECSNLPGSFHTKATGWGVWGSALGTDFMAKDSLGFKGSYDASKYKGISFWAKAAAPLMRVQVSFPDIYTDGGASFAGKDDADAGISQCVYAPDEKVKCSPYLVKFGDSAFPAYQTYQIDTTWKRFDIMFADTLQDQYNKGFHTAADKLDTAHLTAMAIQVNADFSTSPPTPNDYEIWIDDVYFIK